MSSTPSDSPAGADAEKLEVKEGEQDGNGGIDDNDSQRTDEAWKRSPSHPRNFTTSRKWKNAMVIALSGCLSCVDLSALSLPVLTFSAPFTPFTTSLHRLYCFHDPSPLFIHLCSTVGSSIFVPAVSQIRSTYGVSQEVATLTTVMYVAGLGCGPFVFAVRLLGPLSSLFSTRPPLEGQS